MTIARHIVNDLARALAVLAMVFMCLSAGPATASDDSTLVQQASAVASQSQSLCGGGHDQGQQLACHAPNACCRPDQAILPPDRFDVEPAFARVVAVAWGAFAPAAMVRAADPTFRSRAPPV